MANFSQGLPNKPKKWSYCSLLAVLASSPFRATDFVAVTVSVWLHSPFGEVSSGIMWNACEVRVSILDCTILTTVQRDRNDSLRLSIMANGKPGIFGPIQGERAGVADIAS
jgi:hypothetical protein